MTLFLRLFQVHLKQHKEPLHSWNQITQIHFRVLPFDIDQYRHMNHAKFLNYFEAARWDLLNQFRVTPLIKKNNVSLIVAGLDVEYLKPVTLFQKISIKTQIVSYDKRYIYISQEMKTKNGVVARQLVRSVYLDHGRITPPARLFQSIGLSVSELSYRSELAPFTDNSRWLRKNTLFN